MSAPRGLLDLAGRAWDAAYQIDRQRGDTAASEWTARKVRDLIRAGRADDPAEIEKLAEALEAKLRDRPPQQRKGVAK